MDEQQINDLCLAAIERCGRSVDTLEQLTTAGRVALAETRRVYGDAVMFFDAVAHFWKAFDDPDDDRFRQAPEAPEQQ